MVEQDLLIHKAQLFLAEKKKFAIILSILKFHIIKLIVTYYAILLILVLLMQLEFIIFFVKVGKYIRIEMKIFLSL